MTYAGGWYQIGSKYNYHRYTDIRSKMPIITKADLQLINGKYKKPFFGYSCMDLLKQSFHHAAI